MTKKRRDRYDKKKGGTGMTKKRRDRYDKKKGGTGMTRKVKEPDMTAKRVFS